VLRLAGMPSDRCNCCEAIDNDTANGTLGATGLQGYRVYVESPIAYHLGALALSAAETRRWGSW